MVKRPGKSPSPRKSPSAPQPAPRFHRIRSLQIEGGFLDGFHLQFDDSLNCLIGGRGTGKTTVLEIVRWVLDQPPQSAQRARDIDKILRANLDTGIARLQLETADGVVYSVERRVGEPPKVFDAHGEPLRFSLQKGLVFDADVFGQNEIEQLADEPRYQLRLIDKFVKDEIDAVEQQIRTTCTQLAANANDLDRLRREIEEFGEQLAGLPDVNERLKGFAVDKTAGAADEVTREQTKAVQRRQEASACLGADQILEEALGELHRASHGIAERTAACFDAETVEGPNSQVMRDLRDALKRHLAAFERKLGDAVTALKAGRADVTEASRELLRRHDPQEKRFQELLRRHEQQAGRSQERAALLKKQADLLGKEKRLRARQQEATQTDKRRHQLIESLSKLRDERCALRQQVARDLTDKLGPAIRVRIEAFGDTSAYRDLLTEAMKGSGVRYGNLVNRIVERIAPHEFAALVQSGDRGTLEQQLEIDGDRAARIVLQLQGMRTLYDIEVVELADHPVIELLDARGYKDSTSLSTGQKCTTILPIVLLETKRPLLIDQPEDNIDNGFIYDTVVQSIRRAMASRQLIFVTHNPNIPVLGEAGRVFVLESNDGHARIKVEGDVDAVKDDIKTILEGGSEAFERRYHRYGY